MISSQKDGPQTPEEHEWLESDNFGNATLA